MTERNPPLWIDGGCYTGEDLRAMFAGSCLAGVLTPADMAVTAVSGLTVRVAPGSAYVPGTEQVGQGSYLVNNATATNLVLTAASTTNPRIDLIVAHVNDPAYGGTGTPSWSLQVVTGTPASSPIAPAAPASSLVLARIAVGQAAAAISQANITDWRIVCSTGMTVYPDTGAMGNLAPQVPGSIVSTADGSIWRFSAGPPAQWIAVYQPPTAWSGITLISGWVAGAGSSTPSRAPEWRQNNGRIELRGAATVSAATSNPFMAQFPANLRPEWDQAWPLSILGNGSTHSIVGRTFMTVANGYLTIAPYEANAPSYFNGPVWIDHIWWYLPPITVPAV